MYTHKLNIPYYNVYTSFLDTLYIEYLPITLSNSRCVKDLGNIALIYLMLIINVH
jgi:hypothetical protein